MIYDMNINPCAEIALSPIDNPYNFKAGDIVIGNNLNVAIEGQVCIIEEINDLIVYFTIVNVGLRYNVATLKVFRPLTKLERALR